LGMFIEVRLLPLNAPLPIFVTLLGIINEVRLQLANALPPIVVIL